MTVSAENSSKPSRGKALFITGTDTEIGKTHVTCLIARQMIASGFRVGAYKPVCSGATIGSQTSNGSAPVTWDDIERLKRAISPGWPDEIICPQRFLAPVAPPIAAKLEGRSVDFDALVKGSQNFDGLDMLLIEGAGGWLSPISESKTVADLAQKLCVPVIIVARNGLGTINHTLLTIEAIRSRGLEIAGVVLNEVRCNLDDQSSSTNGGEIRRRGEIHYLGLVPYGCDDEMFLDGQEVRNDWMKLAKELVDNN